VPTVEKLDALGLGDYEYIVKDVEKGAAKAVVQGGKA